MPRRSDYETEEVRAHIESREQVVTHAELIALGVPKSVICRRMRKGGPWQWSLPGVVICHTGTPTAREKDLAALRYAGEGAVLTGRSALVKYGMKALAVDRIHVLVPHRRERTSHHFVVIERTRHLPVPLIRGGLPVAPIARATIDAARRTRDEKEVTQAVAEVVQRRMCTPEELRDAVTIAATQRSGILRATLKQIDAGIRSVAESIARLALRHHSVEEPLWNVDLYDSDGSFIASPDGWWDEYGIALQIDSMQWHLSPEDYKRTQAVQRKLARHGVLVFPWAPGDIMRDRVGFRRAVREFLAMNRGRRRPDVTVVRRSDPQARPG